LNQFASKSREGKPALNNAKPCSTHKDIKKEKELKIQLDIFDSKDYKGEEKLRKISSDFCYEEIRTPMFESTELFGQSKAVVKDAVLSVLSNEECGVYQVRQQILESLGEFLESEIGRKPVILPTILEV